MVLHLTVEEKEMLEGKHGRATKKAMDLIVNLGEIYGAERLIPISSVQIAGVSYHNLGEAGLEYLADMAVDGLPLDEGLWLHGSISKSLP